MALRSQKQALTTLVQRGSVGDDLWQRFQRAEKEMEDEVKDVVSEVGYNPLSSSPRIYGSSHTDDYICLVLC
jgi:hypothetical protein